MRSHDSVVLSYLLGSQASRNFEAVSSLELSELLEDAGLDGGVDVLLTAIAVKIRQVEEGLLHIGQLTSPLTVSPISGLLYEVKLMYHDTQGVVK